MDPQLQSMLDQVAQRFRSHRLAWLLTGFWLALAAAWFCGLLPAPSWRLEAFSSQAWIWVVILLVLSLLCLAARWSYRDLDSIAKRVETQFPSLEQRLVTSLQAGSRQSSAYLKRRLIRETVSHGRANEWTGVLASSRLWTAWAIQWLVLAGLAAWLILGIPMPDSGIIARNSNPLRLEDRLPLVVEPGNIELEKGTDLLVTARYSGQIPDAVQLLINDGAQSESSLAMARALNDPLFGGTARNLQRDVRYRVASDIGVSEVYGVKVFEYPRLVRSDADIVPPTYAVQTAKVIEDTRRVTVVDGTQLTWRLSLNKPVRVAELVNEEGETTELVADAMDPTRYSATFSLQTSQRWSLRLIDEQSRSAKFEEELSARVLPNKPSGVQLTSPVDQRASPLQELVLTAKLTDDFGIQRAGIHLELTDRESQDIALLPNSEAPADSPIVAVTKVEVTHRVALEEWRAEPDQLLSYYFWVEDIDRDGNPRRIEGDLFFAEIRPFEELFREGDSGAAQSQSQSQSQSGSQAAAEAEDLAELQKKIITATWNSQRDFNQKSVEERREATEVIAESQLQARTQSDTLSEQITDEKSTAILTSIQEAMDRASDALLAAGNSTASTELRDAQGHERAAYEGLLRLRTREHEIVQTQQSQSQSQSQSASQRNRQQQIDALKLENDESRYENESRPDTEQEASEREMRQVMNRLDELARRQEDLNEQVRALDVALREETEEAKRRELEEELKRLRDNQQELLRDADELLDRMNQESDASSMEDARSQVEEARDQMQQSSQSLSEGETSPAMTAGARAQQNMEETRDELREQSSQGLQQNLKNLVDQATDLERQQQTLEQRMPGAKDAKPGTPNPTGTVGENQSSEGPTDSDTSPSSMLRPELDSADSPPLGDAWKKQRSDLEQLLLQVQETITEAETSEPILADELYDSFREIKQQGTEQNLERIPALLERGLDQPALESAQAATQGIRTLREQIESSSENILGNSTESLRRAMRELDRARDQLQQEIDANTRDEQETPAAGSSEQSTKESENEGRGPTSQQPGNAQTPGSTESQEANSESDTESGQDPASPSRSNPSDTEQPGEGQPGEGQPGEGQRGESQPSGQPKDGQPKDGQATSGQPREGEPSNGQTPSAQRRSGQGNAQGTTQGGGSQTGGASLERMAQATEGASPLTGGEFTEWSDAIRDVEELVSDPDMRAEAARIREAAREMRIEYKRHSKLPEWPLVQRLIAEPMDQLRNKISQELLRKSAEKNQIVPLDRDPVPNQFQRQLDRYFENLGSGAAQ